MKELLKDGMFVTLRNGSKLIIKDDTFYEEDNIKMIDKESYSGKSKYYDENLYNEDDFMKDILKVETQDGKDILLDRKVSQNIEEIMVNEVVLINKLGWLTPKHVASISNDGKIYTYKEGSSFYTFDDYTYGLEVYDKVIRTPQREISRKALDNKRKIIQDTIFGEGAFYSHEDEYEDEYNDYLDDCDYHSLSNYFSNKPKVNPFICDHCQEEECPCYTGSSCCIHNAM